MDIMSIGARAPGVAATPRRYRPSAERTRWEGAWLAWTAAPRWVIHHWVYRNFADTQFATWSIVPLLGRARWGAAMVRPRLGMAMAEAAMGIAEPPAVISSRRARPMRSIRPSLGPKRNLALTSPSPISAWRACNPVAQRTVSVTGAAEVGVGNLVTVVVLLLLPRGRLAIPHLKLLKLAMVSKHAQPTENARPSGGPKRNLALTSPWPTSAWRACNPVARRTSGVMVTAESGAVRLEIVGDLLCLPFGKPAPRTSTWRRAACTTR